MALFPLLLPGRLTLEWAMLLWKAHRCPWWAAGDWAHLAWGRPPSVPTPIGSVSSSLEFAHMK